MNPNLRKFYRLPIRAASSAPVLESNAWLYGRSWTDSALCLPWADYYGAERFAVLSPAYGGEVLICRFQDGWYHKPLDVFITGVTHWRLADYNEQDEWLDPAQWPEPGAMGIGLKAQRWHWLHIDGPINVIRQEKEFSND